MIESSDYSNIGFRSETSIQELRKYSKRENPNPLVIEDAKKLVESFYEIITEKGKYNLEINNRKYYFKLLTEDLLGEKRVISSIPVLTTTIGALEKIANKDAEISKKEIGTAIRFFEEVKVRCKNHLSRGSCH